MAVAKKHSSENRSVREINKYHTFPLFRKVKCSAGGRKSLAQSSKATPGDSTQE